MKETHAEGIPDGVRQAASPLPSPLSESQWGEAREFLRRCVRRRLFRYGEADVQDVTQEAAIRLIRMLRREGASNLEALMSVICQRATTDFIRRQTRHPSPEPLDEQGPDSATPPNTLRASELERLQFALLELFRTQDAKCHELATAYFKERDWRSVAKDLNESHAAIRQQWQRCRAKVKKVARRCPDYLLEWARESG